MFFIFIENDFSNPPTHLSMENYMLFYFWRLPLPVYRQFKPIFSSKFIVGTSKLNRLLWMLIYEQSMLPWIVRFIRCSKPDIDSLPDVRLFVIKNIKPLLKAQVNPRSWTTFMKEWSPQPWTRHSCSSSWLFVAIMETWTCAQRLSYENSITYW